MNLENLVGQTLDEKYRIEKELGRGGMGAVYLATHLGTERPVAVKVIVPQFMQRSEFVERFRREARAAGRLRHPNVVDVTDFGIADTPPGKVAYLVMEYLDGCTLGEILEEEKKLPLSWTLDILEQVSSAIHEAHEQGIIHRDLKPDNIWLEPNQRGGYTVKVLDFGIAKLENAPTETHVAEINSEEIRNLPPAGAKQTQAIFQNTNVQNINAQNINAGDENQTQIISDNRAAATVAGEKQTITDSPRSSKTFAAEAGTLIQPLAEIASESGTAILPPTDTDAPDTIGTKILTPENKETADAAAAPETSSLTRVGAVLGTPLYMSPEQCRGEHLDARSDIYSLAVIAYQMLSGRTPFDGDFKSVMEAHKIATPPKIEVKKVPKKVKRTIMTALAKNADERPPTARIFTEELRAQSEGFGVLMQRAMVIYSEHLPKFLSLTILLYIPLIIFTILKITLTSLYIGDVIGGLTNSILRDILTVGTVFIGVFCGYFIIGTTTWIVIQTLAMPLRPINLRTALKTAQKKWKTFVGTGLLSTVLTFLGLVLCFIGFPILYVLFALVAPVVMMENLRGVAALKRSKNLVMRSLKTTIASMTVMFLVPAVIAILISLFVATTIKSFSDPIRKATGTQVSEQTDRIQNASKAEQPSDGIKVTIGNDNAVGIGDEAEKNNEKGKSILGINGAAHEITTTVLLLPVQILISSFTSIIIALLYLKTRQAGG